MAQKIAINREAIKQLKEQAVEAISNPSTALDRFIADVEASGEDKKHHPTCSQCGTTDIEITIACHNSKCAGYANEVPIYRGWMADQQPIYTQAQRDAYAAEAVKQERERLLAVVAKKRKTYIESQRKMHDMGQPRQASVYKAHADELKRVIEEMRIKP